MTTATLRLRLRTLFRHSRGYPFATNLSLASIPVGLLAVAIGPEVSKAFTIVWHSPTPVYVWGVVLVVGGCNVAVGIARPTPSLERAGLGVLAVAYTFYGISVLIGLGAGGMVTGPFFLAMALSCLQRAHIILKAARDLTAAVTVEEAREAAEEVVHLREDAAGQLENAAGVRRAEDHARDNTTRDVTPGGGPP